MKKITFLLSIAAFIPLFTSAQNGGNFQLSTFNSQLVIGVMIPDGADMDTGVSMPGYPPAFAPLYESLPDRALADALGLGAFGITPDHLWLYPGYRNRPRKEDIRRNMPELRRPMLSGLPLVADVAVRRGSHSWMTYMEGVNPLETAWISGETHGFPYTLGNSDGMGVWQGIWRNCAKWFAAENAAPAAWYLFDNAEWWDTSTPSRREFQKHLAAKYPTPSALSAAFGARYTTANSVSNEKNLAANPRINDEFALFHEERFNAALATANKIFSGVSSNTPPVVFFQARSLYSKGVNLRSTAPHCAIVVAPVQESGRILTPLYLRAVAGNTKPVALMGMRVPPTAEKLRDTLLTQFARGYDQVWLADWRSDAKARLRYTKNAAGKTVRDDDATIAASRALAASRPASILNPYATPPGTLDGIQTAHKIIAPLAPIFTPENRARGTQVAILFKRDAELQTAYDTAAETLMNLHIKTTVIFEDEYEDALTNGVYKLIIKPDDTTPLAELLAAAAVEPLCQCLDPATDEPIDGIEIHHAETPDGASTLLIFNRRGVNVNAKINGKTMTLPPDEMVIM
ncbi:MAG: hypothetical protein FWG05_00515 [Kiritimatiellaeota bacterium]|nr:hypothetical protein [Kiritimatiellota bacterium]